MISLENVVALIMLFLFSYFTFLLVVLEYDLVVSIPNTSVCEIRRYSKKHLPKDRGMFMRDGVELLCSNIQSHRVSKKKKKRKRNSKTPPGKQQVAYSSSLTRW